MYKVYRHYNKLTNKSYIGMTSQEPKKRWAYGWGYKKQPKMWNDIMETDWNKDWVHEILGKFTDRQEALNIEEMFIWLFDSTNDGYNTSSYDSRHYKRSEDTIRKISESMIGKHHSEESKKHISESMTGNHNARQTPVLQFSKEGEFIAEYHSTMEAERLTGCDKSSIGKCCKGKRKQCGSFIWKYKKI